MGILVAQQQHQINKMTPSNRTATTNRKQFSSFLLFLSVIIMVNLWPLRSDLNKEEPISKDLHSTDGLMPKLHLLSAADCFQFVQLMFTNPMRLSKRTTRVTLAEAKVLGKMAKVWYIKKKIKKFGKKLKKHTIAVPVFTAIPIYEHSYYPQHQMSHHHMSGHHAAASAYAPATVLPAPATISMSSSSPGNSNSNIRQHHLATTASNSQHQLASTYRAPPPPPPHLPVFHQPSASAHQIINAYQPSPPLYIDESGGLYGTYGNAYGRYDGGYQYW